MRDAGDNQLRNRLDIDFHDYVYRIARHARLYQTWLMIRTQVFMFLCMRQSLSLTPEMQDSAIAGHREIVAALLARDEPRALHAADAHLVEAYARSIASMPDWWMQDDSAALPPPPSLGGGLPGRDHRRRLTSRPRLHRPIAARGRSRSGLSGVEARGARRTLPRPTAENASRAAPATPAPARQRPPRRGEGAHRPRRPA